MTQLVRKASTGVRTGGSPYCLPRRRKRPVPFPAVRRSIHFEAVTVNLAELVATTEAFPVWAEFVDATSSQDEFSAFCRFKSFLRRLSVEDADHFAAAVGALAGLTENVGDVVGLLAHGAWFMPRR